ncbi:Zn-dependent alcohol dehydrogenase [Thalassiella azotivora]
MEDVELPAVGPGLVRVRIRAAGVCHSDLSLVNGTVAAQFPLVLGHEAAGEVVETGEGVDRVEVGDHVVLDWAPACRACWFCEHGEPWLCERSGAPTAPGGRTSGGEPLRVALGLGALAEEVVVGQDAVIRVPDGLAFRDAALLGCAVLTGYGAVTEQARVRHGESVLVIGLGGVGLSVVGAAAAEGAGAVIAVDVSEAKRGTALAAGATHFLVAGDDLTRQVRALTGGRGADHALECVGRAATIRAAWRSVRRGGRVTVVGMGSKDDVVQLSALEVFHTARTLSSSVYGSTDTELGVPRLADAVLAGRIDLHPLVSHEIALDGVAEAFERMRRGEGARSVVLLG